MRMFRLKQVLPASQLCTRCADAEECAEPTSRATDSSSLGSSKQPTTPQPPGCAAAGMDGDAAGDELREGPAAAAEGTAAEHEERRGGGGSQGDGSSRSALGRKGSKGSKGSERSAPHGKHSRSQQVRWMFLRAG